MDRRGIKRPRSEVSVSGQSTSSNRTKTKKPTTQKKKSTPKTHEESATATPEGIQMSHILSTFNTNEMNRFEAFRRSMFNSKAISKFLASRLVFEEEKRYSYREGARRCFGYPVLESVNKEVSHASCSALKRCPFVVDDDGLGNDKITSKNKDTGEDNREKETKQPELKELVAPNSAQEVTIVVSTLAKAYAQRLVAAARRVATSQNYPEELKLLPEHFREAHYHRVQAGLDPGFFIKPRNFVSPNAAIKVSSNISSSATSAAALGRIDFQSVKYQAALHAQEAFDRQEEEKERQRLEKKSKEKKRVEELIRKKQMEKKKGLEEQQKREEEEQKAKVQTEEQKESEADESLKAENSNDASTKRDDENQITSETDAKDKDIKGDEITKDKKLNTFIVTEDNNSQENENNIKKQDEKQKDNDNKTKETLQEKEDEDICHNASKEESTDETKTTTEKTRKDDENDNPCIPTTSNDTTKDEQDNDRKEDGIICEETKDVNMNSNEDISNANKQDEKESNIDANGSNEESKEIVSETMNNNDERKKDIDETKNDGGNNDGYDLDDVGDIMMLDEDGGIIFDGTQNSLL